jgi:hypothetical protein
VCILFEKFEMENDISRFWDGLVPKINKGGGVVFCVMHKKNPNECMWNFSFKPRG